MNMDIPSVCQNTINKLLADIQVYLDLQKQSSHTHTHVKLFHVFSEQTREKVNAMSKLTFNETRKLKERKRATTVHPYS